MATNSQKEAVSLMTDTCLENKMVDFFLPTAMYHSCLNGCSITAFSLWWGCP
jgi:hypothetical protein